MVIVDCTAIGAPQVAALAFRDTSMFPRIDMAAKDVRRLPQMPFKFRLRKRSH